MPAQPHRRSWLLPAIFAAIFFLGGFTSNLLASTQGVGDFAERYEPWLWAFSILSGVAAVAAAIYDYTRPPTHDSPPDPRSAASEYDHMLRRYLERIAGNSQQLPLAALDPNAANPETVESERIHLQDVYVDLDTTTSRRNESPANDDKLAGLSGTEGPVSALEAVINEKHLLLLGDPGGGKSAFLNYVAFCLAANTLNPADKSISHLKGWPATWAKNLPVLIALRDVAVWFQNTQDNRRKAGLFYGFLEAWLNLMGRAEFYKSLCGHLLDGTAILMLDGLDEVPVRDDVLLRIKEMITDLPAALPNTHIIVTCRKASDDDHRWRLDAKEWHRYELAKLSPEKIDQFIDAWYNQLTAMNAARAASGRRADLQAAVRRPDLRRLSSNPLLLTAMALLHTVRAGKLPDSRAKLYEEVVDLLLWRWEDTRATTFGIPSSPLRDLLEAAGLNEIRFKQVLWKLANEAHAQMKDGDDTELTYDIPRDTLLQAMRQLHPDKSLDWAEEVVKTIQRRAGLLIDGAPGCFKFPHRTFQEYLAGCHLSNQMNFTNRALELSALGAFWREVLLLAVGRMNHLSGNTEGPLILVSELCPEQAPAEGQTAGWRNVWLAGDCLLEIGLSAAQGFALGTELVGRVRIHLTTLVTTGQLNARSRAEAGSTLSAIGDPRDFDEWVPVDAGPFLMGSTDVDPDVQDDEKPQHQVNLDAFEIGKYLVTNAQYARFVEATNHQPPRHWNGNTPPERLLNHPVVYVTWHDARAYCVWKSADSSYAVRLPTEAEWEKAARGSYGRVWPWGNTPPTAEHCNFNRNIGDTTPVGMYPLGESPCHALDMSGNVWEWVNDWHDGSYYTVSPAANLQGPATGTRRVLRGGSWNYTPWFVRAAFRNNNYPGSWNYDLGFRCVRSQ